MNHLRLTLAFLAVLACSRATQDAGMVLNIDTDATVDRSAINAITVTVDGKANTWALTQLLPGSLGIVTSAGSKMVVVEGMANSTTLGRWSGTIAVSKGKVVTQDVRLTCVVCGVQDAGVPSLDGGTDGAAGAGGTGGITGTGGVTSSGGIISTGGLPSTGGATGTAGFTGTGGIRGTGGVTGSGGIISTGGLPSTGGVAGTGGAGIDAAIDASEGHDVAAMDAGGRTGGTGGSGGAGGIQGTGGAIAGQDGGGSVDAPVVVDAPATSDGIGSTIRGGFATTIICNSSVEVFLGIRPPQTPGQGAICWTSGSGAPTGDQVWVYDSANRFLINQVNQLALKASAGGFFEVGTSATDGTPLTLRQNADQRYSLIFDDGNAVGLYIYNCPGALFSAVRPGTASYQTSYTFYPVAN